MLRALPANIREENFGNRRTVYLMAIDGTVIVQIFYIRVYRDSFVELWCRLVYEGHCPLLWLWLVYVARGYGVPWGLLRAGE